MGTATIILMSVDVVIGLVLHHFIRPRSQRLEALQASDILSEFNPSQGVGRAVLVTMILST